MARETAHSILKAEESGRVLNMVRSSDVSNLARIDANERPWGGAIAMARKTARAIFKTNQHDRVLGMVCSGTDTNARPWGGTTAMIEETARTIFKTNKEAFLRITSLSLALVVVVVMGMTTVVVSAQAKTHSTVVLNVPFQFTVGDRLLLPGTYSFEQLLDSAPGLNIIAIRSADGGTYQAAVTTTTRAAAVPHLSRLVFKRYGNSFFLSQVWTKGKLVGLLLYPSRGETRLAEQQAANEEVSVPAAIDSAMIAAALNARGPATHSPFGHPSNGQ